MWYILALKEVGVIQVKYPGIRGDATYGEGLLLLLEADGNSPVHCKKNLYFNWWQGDKSNLRGS